VSAILGVKTHISLDEVKKLFVHHPITKLIPTTSGIIDTTYITDNHILKKYERDVDVQGDSKLLKKLKGANLNVPTCQEQNKGWFLYEKLKGSEPKNIQTYHIVALARFLSRFHTLTYGECKSAKMIDKDEVKSFLNYTKHNFYSYYKKLAFLKNYNSKTDGLIHGDIFKDNTLFEGEKIAVFDFIDSACGSFAFDVAVCLVGFGGRKNTYFINLFLKIYNQKAPRKLKKKEVLYEIDMASAYYALKRIKGYKNTKKAKELVS
jgi:homoserine kinase type II